MRCMSDFTLLSRSYWMWHYLCFFQNLEKICLQNLENITWRVVWFSFTDQCWSCRFTFTTSYQILQEIWWHHTSKKNWFKTVVSLLPAKFQERSYRYKNKKTLARWDAIQKRCCICYEQSLSCTELCPCQGSDLCQNNLIHQYTTNVDEQDYDEL
jgi:hypothetical protein